MFCIREGFVPERCERIHRSNFFVEWIDGNGVGNTCEIDDDNGQCSTEYEWFEFLYCTCIFVECEVPQPEQFWSCLDSIGSSTTSNR